VTRLSRRDRAALTLALEWARVTPGRGDGPFVARETACEALAMGRTGTMRVASAVRAASTVLMSEAAEAADRGDLSGSEERYQVVLAHSRRLLRARLALLLRAILRADAGDFGPAPTCVLCHGSGCSADDANCIADGGCCPHTFHGGGSAVSARPRITPLWAQAARP
jgi:hypothetical protein